MTPTITDLICLLVGLALGGAAMLWLKSRPTTTKAEALKLLAVEASLIAKMPGAAEQKALAEQEAASEVLAAQQFAAALAKLSNVPAQP